jgi:hypothetical protein
MQIATFGPSTGWAGRTIDYEDGRFTLQDHGQIFARDVMSYDAQGHLVWPYSGMREWVRGLAAASPAVPAQVWPQSSESRRGMPVWVIVLIVAGVLLFVVPILAAIAIPMFLNQRDLAHEAAVRKGVHSIQVGVQSWAVDHGDRYPDPSRVSRGGLPGYVDLWPVNPYTDSPMTQGGGPGDFSYAVAPDGKSFQITGYGQGGSVITVP